MSVDPQIRHQRRMVFRMVVVCAIVAYGSLWFQQKEDERKAREAELRALVEEATRPPPAVDEGPKIPKSFVPGARTWLRPPEITERGPIEGVEDGLRQLGLASSDCLQSWWMLDPALRSIELHLVIEPGELKEAWLADHERVPAGPLDCLAEQVYALDWGSVPDAPLEVGYTLDFDPDALPGG